MSTQDGSDSLPRVHKEKPYLPPIMTEVEHDSFQPAICRFFARGICRRGTRCRFVHSLEDRAGVADNQRLRNTGLLPTAGDRSRKFPGQPYRTRPCRYYLSGTCTFGDACKYSHPVTPASLRPNQSEQPYYSPISLSSPPPPTYYTLSPPMQPPPITPTSSASSFEVTNGQGSVLDRAPPPYASPSSALSPILQPVSSNGGVPALSNDPALLSLASQLSGWSLGLVPIPPASTCVPTSNAPPYTRPAFRSKEEAYRTKPCKFYKTAKGCPKGDDCTFIHAKPDKHPKETPFTPQKGAVLPDTPSKPITPVNEEKPNKRNYYDEQRDKNFYPVCWRVIGGGVMMGPSNKFAPTFRASDTHEDEILLGCKSRSPPFPDPIEVVPAARSRKRNDRNEGRRHSMLASVAAQLVGRSKSTPPVRAPKCAAAVSNRFHAELP